MSADEELQKMGEQAAAKRGEVAEALGKIDPVIELLHEAAKAKETELLDKFGQLEALVAAKKAEALEANSAFHRRRVHLLELQKLDLADVDRELQRVAAAVESRAGSPAKLVERLRHLQFSFPGLSPMIDASTRLNTQALGEALSTLGGKPLVCFEETSRDTTARQAAACIQRRQSFRALLADVEAFTSDLCADGGLPVEACLLRAQGIVESLEKLQKSFQRGTPENLIKEYSRDPEFQESVPSEWDAVSACDEIAVLPLFDSGKFFKVSAGAAAEAGEAIVKWLWALADGVRASPPGPAVKRLTPRETERAMTLCTFLVAMRMHEHSVRALLLTLHRESGAECPLHLSLCYFQDPETWGAIVDSHIDGCMGALVSFSSKADLEDAKGALQKLSERKSLCTVLALVDAKPDMTAEEGAEVARSFGVEFREKPSNFDLAELFVRGRIDGQVPLHGDVFVFGRQPYSPMQFRVIGGVRCEVRMGRVDLKRLPCVSAAVTQVKDANILGDFDSKKKEAFKMLGEVLEAN